MVFLEAVYPFISFLYLLNVSFPVYGVSLFTISFFAFIHLSVASSGRESGDAAETRVGQGTGLLDALAGGTA